MLGRYELLEVIAKGGMGIVYRASDQFTGREVALKALPGLASLSDESRQRFNIEAGVLARLDHPAILPVHETGEEDGTPFFTMKLARGGSLAARIGEYAGRWRDIAALVVSMAEAVHFAHERGVLHRDLKPGNILFNENGQVYVADFGLAKILGEDSELTRTLAFIGTPFYMAPERTMQKHTATTASDVWSLGVILYELLTGHLPFHADNLPAVLLAVATTEPPPLPRSVPTDLGIIALKALQKDPAHRYTSALEMAADLRRWLAGEPIRARPLSSMERLQLWVRHHPGTATLISLVALSLLAVSVISFTARRSIRASLRESLITQAEIERSSGRIGQRLHALDALRRAADIRIDQRLVSECAAALARIDATFTPDWQEKTINVNHFPELSPDRTVCASAHPDGGVRLSSATDGRLIRHLPTPEPALAFAFSADSTSLAVRLRNHHVQIWPLTAPTPIADLRIPNVKSLDRGVLASFSRALGAWVVAAEDGSLLKVTPTGDTTVLHGPSSHIPANLSASPTGEHLAIVHRGGLEIWQLTGTVRRLWTVPQVAAKEVLAWHPNGSHLAFTASTGIREVIIVSVPGGVVRARLRGPIQAPARLAFHPTNFLIAGSSEDDHIHLWDFRDGRRLIQFPGANSLLAWSLDGRHLHCGIGESQVGRYTLTDDTVLHEFSGATIYGQGSAADFAVTPDQRLLLTSTGSYLRFWSTTHRRFLSSIHSETETVSRPAFTPDGEACAYTRRGDTSRLVRHSLTLSPDDTTLAIGPPTDVPGAQDWDILEIQPDGSWLVRHSTTTHIQSWPQGDSTQATTLFTTSSANTRPSPDGRWFVSVKTEDDGILIRDRTRPAWQHLVPLLGTTSVRWAPNGQWVFVRGAEEHLLLQAGSWRVLQRWPTDGNTHGRKSIAISADSARLSYSLGNDAIQLHRLPHITPLQTLVPPMGLDFHRALFSRDGTRLWTMGVAGRVFEWNFASLQSELSAIGVPWQW